MARCSGIRLGCIIVSSRAVRPKRQRQRQPGGGPCAPGGAEQLLWGPVARNLHMKARLAEKSPAGKAAELVLGDSWGIRGWVEHGRDCVGPGLGRVGPAALYLLVRTDWRL